MNILIVNHHAGSRIHGMVYRHYYFAREWVKSGHSVTVIAASYSHVRSICPDVDRPVTEEEIDGIRYVWLKAPSYSGNSLGRVANMMTFVSRLGRHGLRLVQERKPDIVVSSSTYHLDIFSAHRIARKCGAQLVFEVRDLWPLTLIMLGDMGRWNPLVLAMQVSEDFGYRHADTVVSALPLAREYMQSRGMSLEKFRYIPNGVDPTEWEGKARELPDLHREEFARIRKDAGLIVGFTGAHGVGHDLETLIEAAALLSNLPVAFALVGSGSQKTRLQEIAREKGVRNVLFLPPVPKSAVPALMDAMDVLYIGLKRHPLFRFGVSPHKLLDYMMAAKPIVHAIDAGNDMVREAECGMSILPGDSHALSEALMRLANLSPHERAAMGMRGRDYVLKNHDYRDLARRFLESLPGRER